MFAAAGSLAVLASILFNEYPLVRYDVPATYAGALCNDGTAASFYLSPGHSDRCWVLFFEGGGFCTDAQDCAERIDDARARRNGQRVSFATSSIERPPSYAGATVLSEDPETNSAYASCRRVFVPCEQQATARAARASRVWSGFRLGYHVTTGSRLSRRAASPLSAQTARAIFGLATAKRLRL